MRELSPDSELTRELIVLTVPGWGNKLGIAGNGRLPREGKEHRRNSYGTVAAPAETTSEKLQRRGRVRCSLASKRSSAPLA